MCNSGNICHQELFHRPHRTSRWYMCLQPTHAQCTPKKGKKIRQWILKYVFVSWLKCSCKIWFVQLLAYIWSTMCNYWPTYDQQYLIWFVYLFSKWKKCGCFSVWQLLLIWKLIRNRCKTVQLNLRSKSFFDSIIHYLWQKIKQYLQIKTRLLSTLYIYVLNENTDQNVAHFPCRH